MELYYLTPLYENNVIKDILNHGIYEDSMYGIGVVLCLDFTQWKNIHQYYKLNYVLIEILEEGISGEVMLHHYGEESDEYQIFIEQDWIDPKFIRLEGIYNPGIPLNHFDDFQYN